MRLTKEDMRARRHEGSNPDMTATSQARISAKGGQSATDSMRQAEQEHKRHSRIIAMLRKNIAEDLQQQELGTRSNTPTSPPLAMSRQPTLRINIKDDDDSDNDARNDDENQAAMQASIHNNN